MLHAIASTSQPTLSLPIDYFPVRGGKGYLRYAITPRCGATHGTVLLLIDHGETIEDYAQTIIELQQRKFHIAIFDWFGQGGSSREECDALKHFRAKSGHRFCLRQNAVQNKELERSTEPSEVKIALEKSTETSEVKIALGGHISDFRDLLGDLSEIFVQHFLPDLPAPFYVLGHGMGGLLALAAHDILKSQIRRMILTSPLLQPAYHPAGGSFHIFARLMSDLGMGLWRTNTKLTHKHYNHDPITLTRLMRSQNPRRPTGYPTLATYATLLDAAQIILSPTNYDRFSMPTLFVLAQHDPISSPHVTRLLAQNLRVGAHLILRGASRDILHGNSRYQKQFWRIFDRFIPGTGAPHPSISLEEGLEL